MKCKILEILDPKRWILFEIIMVTMIASFISSYFIVYTNMSEKCILFAHEVISTISSLGTFAAAVFAAFLLSEMLEQQSIERQMLKEAKEQKEYTFKPKIIPLDTTYILEVESIENFEDNSQFKGSDEYLLSKNSYLWLSKQGAVLNEDELRIEIGNLGHGVAEILDICWKFNYINFLKQYFKKYPELKTDSLASVKKLTEHDPLVSVRKVKMPYFTGVSSISPRLLPDTKHLDHSKIIFPYVYEKGVKTEITIPDEFLKLLSHMGSNSGFREYFSEIIPTIDLEIMYKDLSNRIFKINHNIAVICINQLHSQSSKRNYVKNEIMFKLLEYNEEEIKDAEKTYV
ncbi:hypothetical protein [Methanococcus maripaludis]|uniref:Uncharacterized protein n=1 Tax=Methanococcus maripaludis TaxID=39152 RepID=A0A7J9PE85_METMI|nr:hypothetical protein [Methanococcus maripaludis]MBA2861104.1 hypothetical protein [Methanococcus maripaludis]